jgi:dihydroxyacetone kinase DhaKLM complex PTS-EIIA-like component DhaM
MNMKFVLSVLFCLLAGTSLWAQFTPQGFNYQSVVRDNTGKPLANQAVTLLFSIRSGAPNGPIVYSERHSITTNEYGLTNLVVGKGSIVQGTFAAINWSGGAKFMTVALEISPNLFDELGSTELLSVPYALYAQSSGGGGTGGGDNWGSQTVATSPALEGSGTAANPLTIARQGATNGQVLKWNGTAWTPQEDISTLSQSGGTVTQITTGTGLTGGTITTTGTIGLANSGVTPGIYGSATQIPVLSIDAQGRVTQVFTVVPQPGTVGITGGGGIGVQQNGLNFTITNTGDTNPADDLTNTSTADGDVNGPFSNLQIKPDVVTNTELADNAVGTANMIDGSVTAGKLNNMGAASGQVLKWNGTAWAPAVDNTGGGTGTVTINNGTGISVAGTNPFTITNTGDTNAADDITTSSIADGDVSGPFSDLQLKADAVGTVNLSNSSVTASKLSNMGASSGQVLKWNGVSWAPAADNTGGGTGTVNINAGAGISVAGTNPFTVTNTGDTNPADDLTNSSVADGDVSGPFSNLQLKADVVTNTELADNAVGTANVIPGSITADKLNNMGAANGQVLKWNGTAWTPQVDLSGGAGSTVAAGTGINVTTNANTFTVINTGDTNPSDDITTASVSGGDVNGPFSNLQLNAGVVTNTELANSAVSTVNIVNGAVTAAKLSDMGATNGQVLKWNGTAWTPQVDLSGGAGSTVAAGTGINVTTSGNTFTVINTGDTNPADDLTNSSVADGDVSGPFSNLQLKADVVTNSELADNAVGTANVIPGSITADKLNNMGAANGQVLKWNGTAWAPQADVAGSSTVAGGAGINVTTSGSTFTVINTGDTNPTDDITTASIASGDVSGPFSNLQLNAGVVTNTELANNAVGTTNIVNGAVTAAKLSDMGAANGQVLKWNGTAWAPQADVAGSSNVAGGAGINVTTSGNTFTVINTGDTNPSDDITTASIANGDVSGPFSNLQLNAGVVTNTELANNAVGTTNIVNGAVTAAKLSDMGAANGQVLKWNGTAWAPQADVAGSSNVAGGAGINVTTSGNTFTVINTGDTDPSNDITTASTAGGDVSGPFSNLQLKEDVVTNTEIADNAVGTANIITGSITAAKLNNMGAANGQVLKWNGTTWAPATDVSGSTTVAGGAGINVTTSGNTFTVINTGDTDPSNDITTASTAGGDVSGPFSNLQLNVDVVTNTELANNAVATENIVNGAVTAAKLNDMGAANGQVLKWNGTAWAPAADNTGTGSADNWGTQTAIVGAALTGNGTTANPLNLAAQGAVNGQTLKWNGSAWVPANDVSGNDNWGTQTAIVGAALTGNGTTANPLNLAAQGAVNGQTLKWNGSAWVPANDVSGNDNWGAQTAIVGAALTGNGTPANPLNLAAQGAVNGQTLKWNGSAWVPANDVSGNDNWGTQTAIVGAALTGNGTTANPLNLAAQGAVNGQTLKWNGSAWVPANDVSGNDNWGTQTAIVGAALTGNGTTANPLNLAAQGAVNGQTLKWNGSAWVPANDVSGNDNWGTQTASVGTALTGNGTPASPINLAPQGASNGQVLKWNGAAWTPGTDETGSGGGSSAFWVSSSTNNINSGNSGNVGIGVTMPTFKFQVAGQGYFNGTATNGNPHLIVEQSGAGGGRIGFGNTSALGRWVLGGSGGTTGTHTFSLDYTLQNGGVQVNDRFFTVQSNRFDLGADNYAMGMRIWHNAGTGGLILRNGDVSWRIFTLSNGLLAFAPRETGSGVGFVDLNGNFQSGSDARLKKDIAALPGVLERVLRLEPVSYRFKRQSADEKPVVGFIAQDVQQLFPEMVGEQPGQNGEPSMLSLSYAQFGVLAIKAIQEQQQQLNTLKTENQALRTQLDSMEARLKRLEER